MKSILILLASLLFSSLALADNIDTYQFDSVTQEQQYRHLTESLRCPKCQNNSIADSNAMIAGDMRLKVYQLLRAGQTPEQVKAYMVARYGNFVSYQPPLTAIDKSGVEKLMALFVQHAEQGGAVILTTHQDLPGAAQRVSRIRLTCAGEP